MIDLLLEGCFGLFIVSNQDKGTWWVRFFSKILLSPFFSMYRRLMRKLSMRFFWRCWITTSNGANTCENALLGIGLVPPVILKELFFKPLVWFLFVSCSIEAINRDRKIFMVSLYFLIWGEAANVRFLPECICYIFHQVSLAALSFNSLSSSLGLLLALFKLYPTTPLQW